jgi:uncharacterized zinc-type alcohol dehydrogenase-like protein
MKILGYAATSPESPLAPFDIERRELRGNDVAIEISHCGVCHSDLHAARNDWGFTTYPIVPGHELVGTVTAVGPEVTMHKIGDRVAVGCLVDSCMECDQCHRGEEQFCRKQATGTYGGRDRIDGSPTHGGYSKAVVVREEFVCKVPDSIELAHAAPLLCAGITVYSPLRAWNVGPGSRVGVAGLGGLGHMAVKLAAAMGAHVTVMSRTQDKRDDALALGAHAYIATSDSDAMKSATNSMDLIIDTVPVEHDLEAYFPLLDIDGSLVIVGQIGALGQVNSYSLLYGRRRLSASMIGGIAETQEMLDLCGEKNVVPEIEIIRMDEINQAFERMERADVRYRFVIDMATLQPA